MECEKYYRRYESVVGGVVGNVFKARLEKLEEGVE